MVKNMAGFNNHHRYFVQYMLKRGVTTIENAHKYCQYVSQGEIENVTQLKTLVLEINRQISKQFYKIVFNVCEVTNKSYLIWLNTKNDDISKLQITYSALELEYFHSILQEIVRSEDHRITFIVCINITSTLTAFFSRENGQKVLMKWIKNGYFINKNPFIYLGPRLILEFTSYLKTHIPNSICSLCSELVFWGKTCASCDKTVHSYCLKKYLENQNNCPSCLAVWTSPLEEQEMNETNMEMDQTEESQTTAVVHSSTRDSEQNSCTTSEDTVRSSRSNTTRRKNVTEDNYSSDEDPNLPGPSTRKRHR